MKPRSTVAEIVTLAAFCAFLLFFGLGAFGLVGADEPRYAQIAREMLARHDWVVPVLNGKPWLEKPVLYYWEAMISYRLFGVSDWAARVPGAFSATTMVLGIYVFWRRGQKSFTTEDTKQHEGAGDNSAVPQFGSSAMPLDVALIALSTAAVIGYGRAASTDMPLAANFTIAMLCWIARCAEPESPGTSGSQARLHPRLLLFYVFLAVATLAKGPVAPGLAAVIIVIFAALRRDVKVIWQTLWWPGIVVYLVIAAPWYWLVQERTGNFFRFFFLEQNLQRYTSNVYHHPQPFWFYIPVTLLALVPWLVWAVCGWWHSVRSLAANRRAGAPGATPETQLELFLAVWAIVPVVFFSFSGSKLPGYILPAIPAWVLLAALSVARRGGQRSTLLVVLHSAIAAGLVAAVIIAPYRTLRVPVTGVALGTAVIVAVAIFVGIAITLLRRGMAWLRFVTLVPVVLAVAYILRIGAPALDAKLSARPVAQELARIETKPVTVAVLHVKRELEYGLNFYRNQPIASYDRAEIPVGEHLVVARAGSESELTELVGGRRVVRLGEYPPQNVEFFWVTNPMPAMSMPMR